MNVSAAAAKASVSPEKLESWEAGTAKPTVRQARLLAAAYRQSLAAFYLDAPPASRTHLPKDFRRQAGADEDGISSSIRLDVMSAWDKRAIALELLASQGLGPRPFTLQADISADPELVASQLREQLGIELTEQIRWREPRRAFNAWRVLVEQAGVLVLQTSEIPLATLRAYSLYAVPLPVVVVNRKDVPAGRSFSLIHELVHLALRTEGLCDLSTDLHRPPEEQRVEVFCNAVAAAVLIPKAALQAHSRVAYRPYDPQWTDADIEELARHFSTSREALVRRLLTLGLTTQAFYSAKRAEYQEQYASRPATSGFTTPTVDTISLLGRTFVRLVLDSLNSGTVTSSDASDYLDIRLKHLPALSSALEAE